MRVQEGRKDERRKKKKTMRLRARHFYERIYNIIRATRFIRRADRREFTCPSSSSSWIFTYHYVYVRTLVCSSIYYIIFVHTHSRQRTRRFRRNVCEGVIGAYIQYTYIMYSAYNIIYIVYESVAKKRINVSACVCKYCFFFFFNRIHVKYIRLFV